MTSGRSSLLVDLHYIRRNISKSKFIYIADTGRHGLGIFAARSFLDGEKIVSDQEGEYFDGALSLDQVRSLGLDLCTHCFQVDHDRFLLPSGSVDDLINHSCEPNAGIRLTELGYDLIALRDIDIGEELTYDYSTYIASPERLICSCGAAGCRGEVGRFSELAPSLRARYIARGVVGAFAAASVRPTGARLRQAVEG